MTSARLDNIARRVAVSSAGSVHRFLRLAVYTDSYGWQCTQIPTAGSVHRFLRLAVYTDSYGWQCTQIPTAGSVHRFLRLAVYTDSYGWQCTQIPTAGSVHRFLRLAVYTDSLLNNIYNYACWKYIALSLLDCDSSENLGNYWVCETILSRLFFSR